MAHIDKRQTSRGVRYDVRYRTPNGAVRTRTFQRRKDAEAHKSLVEADMLRGEWYDARLGRVFFDQWADRWQATTVNLRPSTRARDDAYLKGLIRPTFGEQLLSDIDRLSIAQWVAKVSTDHAPATVVKAHQILSKVLRAAVDAGMLPSNPCERVALPRIERHEMRFLEPSDVATLADAMDPRYRALVHLACFGGLRAGELFGLRAGAVDPLRRRVTVTEICVEVRGQILFGPPKTRAGRRSVPLPRFVADTLATHMRDLGVAADELVFPAPEGGPVRLSLWRRRSGRLPSTRPAWSRSGSTTCATPRWRCGSRPARARRTSPRAPVTRRWRSCSTGTDTCSPGPTNASTTPSTRSRTARPARWTRDGIRQAAERIDAPAL